jgi:phosphatidylserine/phosphatidylglycerophosphate/cardiolipin synthase-like enzyme
LGVVLAASSTVYEWPRDRRPKHDDGRTGSLHVKCALADDDHLLISSANLTEFALNLNMELGMLVRGGDIPRRVGAHLRGLIESGVLTAIRSG